MFINIFLFIFFFFSIIFSSKFIFIVLLLSIINLYVECPKCRHTVGLSKNGYITFSHFKSFCQKCGQDLKKCNIESDDIINKRIKK